MLSTLQTITFDSRDINIFTKDNKVKIINSICHSNPTSINKNLM